jgi:TolB-like protein/Tfp pilus assembly protein PilF
VTLPDRLEELAHTVLDGSAVDWESAEAGADPEVRSAIRQLQRLERLAQFHRDIHGTIQADTPEAAAADALVLWGHLEIRGVLGRGAFGTVYRAWDASLDREVALKLLPAPSADLDRAAPSLIEEGRLLARVRHPNVVAIHGAARLDDQIGLWMELVRGQTLEARLAHGHRFGAADTIRIGRELCGAVSAVHTAGLLHRDIKTQNVVQAEDGRIVLMDLGAGREVGGGSRSDAAGTPLYLAPEVLAGSEATVQSDVYAIGVLLYRLLTAAYPVTAATIPALCDAHAAGARVDVRRVNRDVPPALARTIDRATDADPSRRYRSVDCLAADLARIERPHPLRQIAAIVLTAGLAAFVWTLADRGSRPDEAPRLAILAFETAVRNTRDDVLATGLTREIQRNLAALDGLVLLAFGSAAPDANTPRDAVETGRALDADFVLEGSAVRSGDMLRVHARLVRVADAHVAWSNTYDRATEDIFAIQDDISRAIADELRVTLRLPRRHDIGLDVYFDFLNARVVQSHRSQDHMREAAALFEAVVVRAPQYAPAWAGIATSLADEARLRDVPYPSRMKEAAQRAIQLDEFQAEAQQAMGSLFAAAGQWRDADAAFLRALAIDPSLTFLYTEFALSSLLPQRRLDEALDYLDTAQRRNPLSLDVARVKALVLVEAGCYLEAIATSRWVLDRDPGYPFANLWLGRALALLGRPEEALRHYGDVPGTEAYRGYALAVLERRDEAAQLAAALEGEPHRQMLIYGGLRDVERAFAALDVVVTQNPWRAATWMIRPEVAILRDDPRYGIIRDRLNLPSDRGGRERALRVSCAS